MEFQFSLHLGATSGEGKFGDRKILQKDKERGQRSRHLLTFKNFRTWRCLSVIPKKKYHFVGIDLVGSCEVGEPWWLMGEYINTGASSELGALLIRGCFTGDLAVQQRHW